jgi:osmotically-inducible protein OsmY
LVKRTDDETARILRAALRTDSRVSASRIKVEVRDGKVTLGGRVPTYSAKLAAMLTASEMPGVTSVADKIDVDPCGKLSDHEISEHVTRALDARADIPEKSIAVSVRRGRCTLAGSVPTHAVSQSAAEVALSCKGVRSVRNLVVIDPESVVRDSELVRRVRTLLEHQESLGAARINVRAIGGRVVLSGQVPSLARKLQAGKVAGRPVGVKKVINRLRTD